MIQFFTNPYVKTVVSFGAVQARKYVDSKIEEQIVLKVQKKVEEDINSFFLNIWNRSKIYLGLLVLNIVSILMLFYFKNLYFGIGCVVFSSIFSINSILVHIKGVKRILYYIEHFEENLKGAIEKEFMIAKSENLMNKVAFLINSKRSNDYYSMVVEQIIKCIAVWLKNNKSLIYLRFGFYVMSSVLFTLSLREVFLHLYVY